MSARITIIVTTIAGLTLAACGGSGAPSPDSTDELEIPDGRSGVFLEIGEEGGFVPVTTSLTRVPRFVVFSDGTVVRQATGRAVADRAFPLFRSELADEDLADLLTFTDDMGLSEIDRVDVNEAANVADAPTTTVTLYDEAGPHTLGVYGLTFDEPTDARAAILQSMIALLDEATTPLGDPYEPARYEALVSATDVNPNQPVQDPWPLPARPGEMRELGFADWRCAVVDAADVDTALLEPSDGPPGSVWSFEGTPHTVLVRPLFPHQEACER